jgi:hypothetical protein
MAARVAFTSIIGNMAMAAAVLPVNNASLRRNSVLESGL